MEKKFGYSCLILAGLCILSVISSFGRPLDVLVLTCGEKSHCTAGILIPLGRSITARYEHSVERTPVDDIYYATGGALRQWRTRTRSHNAGLPWQSHEHGRFLAENSWMVLEGGFTAWEKIYLRVGDPLLGRNELFVGNDGVLRLYERFPGIRLCLSSERERAGLICPRMRIFEVDTDDGFDAVKKNGLTRCASQSNK